MDYNEILERIKRLEYHQSLLLKMSRSSTDAFYKLIIEKSLDEKEVKGIYKVCAQLSKELQEQKAEGFVYFHPLFQKFDQQLHHRLQAEEVINACLMNGLYTPLLKELKKYS